MVLPFFQQGAFANTGNMTPEQIAQKRAYIAAMMPRFGSAKYVGEGLGQLATGVMVGRQNRKLDGAEKEGRKSAEEMFARLMSGEGSSNTNYSSSGGGSPSGTWTPAPPPPSPIDVAMQGMDVAKAGGLSFGLPQADPNMIGVGKERLGFGAAVMTPQEMLIEGAKRRGLDPIDVATAISYETGGKFDPLIKGPTTQWGTHEGLIQFGDPQGQEHGAVFDQGADAAWRSQLNPESGAVWSYLDSVGVKPGMGLPEIYSGINAGAVGRMGASDANNGGAPGTVADKVAGMGPHREKAAAFLGGTWTPDPNAPPGQSVTISTKGGGGGQGGIPMPDLIAAMSNPWLSPQERAVVTSMYEQQVQQADPMRQLELQKAQLELERMQNPQQQPVELKTFNGPDGKVYSFNPMTGETTPLTEAEQPEPGYRILTPDEVAQMRLPSGSYQMGPNGEIKPIGGGGVNVSVSTGGEVGTIPQGFELFTDPTTGARSMRPIPGGPEDTSKNDAAKANNAATASDVITTATDRALTASQSRVLGGIAGSITAYNPSSKNAELYRQVDVLKSNAKIETLQAMRNESPTGGALGSVTEPELKMLEDAAGALSPASPNFERDLMDYTRTLLRVIHGRENGDIIFDTKYGQGGEPKAATSTPAAPPQIQPPQAFVNHPSIQQTAENSGLTPEEIWEAMTPEARARYGG